MRHFENPTKKLLNNLTHCRPPQVHSPEARNSPRRPTSEARQWSGIARPTSRILGVLPEQFVALRTGEWRLTTSDAVVASSSCSLRVFSSVQYKESYCSTSLSPLIFMASGGCECGSAFCIRMGMRRRVVTGIIDHLLRSFLEPALARRAWAEKVPRKHQPGEGVSWA